MANPRLHLHRRFNWGLLLLADQASTELPGKAPAAPTYVAAAQSAAAIAVRHAQDVDFDAEPAEVTVDLYVDAVPEPHPTYLGSIDIPSGVIEVGDAEETQVLNIGAGHWTLQIST